MHSKSFHDLRGFERYFSINILGEVYSKRRNKLLKQYIGNNGYWTVSTKINNKRKYLLVHRLLAIQFIECNDKSKDCVNHIDGNKLNNSLENLEWVTRPYNTKEAFNQGLHKLGEDHHNSKLTRGDVKYILDNPDGLSAIKLGEKFDIHRNHVYKLRRIAGGNHVK